MYAQIIDDTVGNTLVSASTLEKEIKAELEKTNNVDAAAYLGTVIAKRAIEKGITEIDILHDNKAKELHFNNANEWLYTTWDVKEREIQEIADRVKVANPGFHIDDIDYKESADNSKVYIFELEQGDNERQVTVDMNGNIIE